MRVEIELRPECHGHRAEAIEALRAVGLENAHWLAVSERVGGDIDESLAGLLEDCEQVASVEVVG